MAVHFRDNSAYIERAANRQIARKAMFSVRRFFVVYRLCVITTVTLLMLTGFVFAQSSQLLFERISREQGLSESSITAILQDRRGFLWVGTQNGLNRYDGYTFTIFRQDPTDSLTLSSNNIRSLYEDRNGTLWIGTANGLNRFDRLTGRFYSFKNDPESKKSLSNNDISSIAEDKDGNLWIGTKRGLNRFNPRTQEFKYFKHDKRKPVSLSDNDVTVVYADSTLQAAGLLWVGTRSGGLDLFNLTTFEFTHFTNDAAGLNILSDNAIASLCTDWQGNLWVGTRSGGLNRLSRKANGEDGYDIQTFSSGLLGNLSDNSVRSLFADKQGHILIGTRNGLDIFTPSNCSWSSYKNSPSNLRSLSDNDISALYQDRTGVVWIGTSGAGLNKLISKTVYFQTTRYSFSSLTGGDRSSGVISAFYQSSDGKLWLGGNGGLTTADNAHQFTSEGGKLSDDYVKAILQDHSGMLWVGTEGGLNQFDPASGRNVVYRHNPLDSTSLSDDFVNCLYKDRSGNLWIGTSGGGLNRLNSQTGAFTIFKNDPMESKSLGDNFVFAIREDRAGNLWIGTSGGLNKYNATTNNFTVYRHEDKKGSSLGENSILSLHEDKKGNLWIGTYGGGLDRFDAVTGTFNHLREKDGLPSDVIYGILEDARGRLWLSTGRGLASLEFSDNHTRKPIVRLYDASDGLLGNEFRKGAYYQGRDGTLYFGVADGFNAFHPDSLHPNPHVPMVVLTSFRKFNQVATLDTNITEKALLMLDYTDNTFSFEFAALDFANPAKNQYAYRMSGFDDRWIVLGGGERMARFTNLDPGEYTFQVTASNNDGAWNEAGVSLRIIIRPPWWRALWFQVLVALSSFGAVLGVYKWRVRAIQSRTKRLELLIADRTEEVTEKNAELARLLDDAEVARAETELAYKLLEIENARKTSELDEARLLQLSMLPKHLPQIPNLDIAFFMRTATEVGGDYYDYRVSQDDTLTLAVGDATGHGVRAGMLVSIVKSNFHATAEFLSVSDIAAHIGRNIKRMNLHKMFMCLTVLRYKQGALEMSGAGMPPALLYRCETQAVELVRLRGIVLGAVEHFDYQTLKLNLACGDTLLLMSDGLLELFNSENEELGEESIKSCFQSIGHLDSQSIINRMNSLADEWLDGAPQNDDIALVVMKAA